MPPTPAPGKEGNFDGQISFLELFNYASPNTKTHVMRIRSLLQEPLLRGEIAGDCQLAVALPTRPQRLPSRFYRDRISRNDFSGGIVSGPDLITASDPQACLALKRTFDLLQFGSYSSEGVPKVDCQKAVTACNEAMRLEPGNPFSYFFRGIAYRILGEYDHALADFQKIDMPLRLKMNYMHKPVELKLGDQVGGTVDSSDVLVIAEVRGKMLRVESVTSSSPSEEGPSEKEPPAKQGWIHQRYVKKELQFLNHDPEFVLRYILDKDGSLVKLNADAPGALEALLRVRDILYGNEKSEYDALRRDMTAAECDRAIVACSEALRIEPDKPVCLILRGLAKRKKHDFEGALADFQKLDLPLCVRANVNGSMQLKIGDKVTGEIHNGNDLTVTQINGDWLWVDSVEYSDGEKHGWLLKQYVK